MRSGTMAMICLGAFLASTAQAAKTIDMNLVDENGIGKPIGQVTLTETPYGVVFTPALEGLPPGPAAHGFHVHEHGSCVPADKEGKKVAALGAGGHYDPAGSKHHGAPWGDGHLGDLPPLFVDAAGTATQPVLAPRLKLDDLNNRALIIHAGGDNFADQPAPLGGGGARIACG